MSALDRRRFVVLAAGALGGVAAGGCASVAAVTLRPEAGQLRVDPGRPDNSFLLIKLVGPPLGAGSRMPLLGDPLDAGQIQLVADWILQGAQP